MKPLLELPDEALASLALRAQRELPDAPTWLIESALSMWRAPQAAPTIGRRIAAVLGFDSWAAQPTLALRSALPSERQQLFTAQGRDIDLRVSPMDPASRPPTRFVVSGQVLGPGENGIATLKPAGEFAATAALDDFGEFRFSDLAPGTYVLSLNFADEEILLPEIHVGAEPQT